MQGDLEVLTLLNEQLTSELTAINQYFLHSKMQHYWGFTELAETTRKASFDEMNHAEWIIDRILILDGYRSHELESRMRSTAHAGCSRCGWAKYCASNSKPIWPSKRMLLRG